MFQPLIHSLRLEATDMANQGDREGARIMERIINACTRAEEKRILQEALEAEAEAEGEA
jgi:hypothetical protein